MTAAEYIPSTSGKFTKVYAGLINEDNTSIGIQHPLPCDGDSVYAKDVWIDESDMGDFSGEVTDLFDNLHSVISNTTSDNPKEILIHFNRTIPALVLALGAYAGNFSNVKIIGLTSGEVEFDLYDDSSNNTKKTTTGPIYIPTTGFNAIKLQFHTTDTVTLSNFFILKAISGTMRIQGRKPDGTFTEFQSTTAGNSKTSLEEYDDIFLDNPLPVTKGFNIPIYDDVTLTYVASGNGAGEIETVVFKYLTVTVTTLTLSYNSDDKLINVVQT